MMSEQWPVMRLGDVCSFDKHTGNHSGLPYIGMEDIESNTGRFIGDLSPREMKSSTFKFSPKHVLYGRLRPYLNKVIVPDFHGHCSSEIFPILPNELVLQKYLQYWLLKDSTVSVIDATSTGTRMPRANMKQVLEFEIPIPSVDEQQRIVSILDEAFVHIRESKNQVFHKNKRPKELAQSLLSSTFDRKEGWTTMNLEECAKFIDYRGKTPQKTDSGLRLITAKNAKMGYLQIEPREFVAHESYDAWMTRGIPLKGDVIFTTEAPLANVCQLDTDEKVVFAQRIITLQPNREILNPAFLKYSLMSPQMQSIILKQATGATVSGIKAKLLKKVEVSFPPIEEQNTIIQRVDSLFENVNQIEKTYQQELDSHDELKQSILQEAFDGKLTGGITA